MQSFDDFFFGFSCYGKWFHEDHYLGIIQLKFHLEILLHREIKSLANVVEAALHLIQKVANKKNNSLAKQDGIEAFSKVFF